MGILGAPVRPPSRLEPVSHTGATKTSPIMFGKIYENRQFIDKIRTAYIEFKLKMSPSRCLNHRRPNRRHPTPPMRSARTWLTLTPSPTHGVRHLLVLREASAGQLPEHDPLVVVGGSHACHRWEGLLVAGEKNRVFGANGGRTSARFVAAAALADGAELMK
jgi:hypothetical protein